LVSATFLPLLDYEDLLYLNSPDSINFWFNWSRLS